MLRLQQKLKYATNQANIWKGEMQKLIHNDEKTNDNMSLDPQDINLLDKFSQAAETVFSGKKPKVNPYKIDSDLASRLSTTNYQPPVYPAFMDNFNSQRNSVFNTEPADNYNQAYKYFEPTNNIVMANDDRKYDQVREMGISEMCFNSDFVDIVNKILYHEGNYYLFKSKFFEI